MTTDELKNLIARLRTAAAPLPEADAEALRAAIGEYPYFPALRILMLKCGEPTAAMRQAAALEATSDRVMAAAAQGSGRADFYPAAPPAESVPTEDVIDRFLSTYGNLSPDEEAQLEKMILNPTPDYGEVLAREEQENLPSPDEATDPDSQEARLNAFILAQHPAAKPVGPVAGEPTEPETPPAPVARPKHSDDTPLSESLALLFIKRGRYERAYEIISGLSLKFPKKSAYFADQLRFLQILIKNQRLSEGQNPDGRTE